MTEALPLAELEPFKTAWGDYKFRLHVERDGQDLRVHSPDLRGFRPVFRKAALAGISTITQSVQISLSLNFNVDRVDVYYHKPSGPHWLVDGTDEGRALPPGNGYEIFVVPEGTLKNKLATLPKETVPPGTCPVLQPAF